MARGKGRPPVRHSAQPAQEQTTRLEIQQRHETWSGPLPPPAALEAFENVAPGTAVKIVDEFQAEAAHRRHMERREASLTVAETLVGQLSAILFALSALGVAAYSAYVGAEWVGGIVGGGVIVSGIVALRKARKK